MPKTKTVSHAAPSRRSPRAKKARVVAEKEADTTDSEVLDLTESSDEEIQEIKQSSTEEREPTNRNQSGGKARPTGLIVNAANIAAAGTAVDKHKATVSSPQNLAMYMSNLAADVEAQKAAKKRQEYINNFLAKPAAREIEYVPDSRQPGNFITKSTMYNQHGYGYLNQRQLVSNPRQFQTSANPASQTIDLTIGQGPRSVFSNIKPPVYGTKVQAVSSGTGSSAQGTGSGSVVNFKKKIESESSSSSSSTTGNGEKMVMEFETGYKCMRCLEFCESRADLKHHIIKVHTDLLSFKCGKCGEVFSRQEKLEKHERSHGREKSYVCIHCEMCFYQLESLKRHEKTHEVKKEHKCSGCSRVFTEMEKLVMHERIHNKSELPFQCEECDEGFHARGNLKMHIRTVHTKKGKGKRR